MNRAVRTATPVRVTSLTSTTPRAMRTSTLRPARVAATSSIFRRYNVVAMGGEDLARHRTEPAALGGGRIAVPMNSVGARRLNR